MPLPRMRRWSSVIGVRPPVKCAKNKAEHDRLREAFLKVVGVLYNRPKYKRVSYTQICEANGWRPDLLSVGIKRENIGRAQMRKVIDDVHDILAPHFEGK